MKKILILAYDFPPYNSMGSQRPFAWFKYFHEYGLYPIVVTRHWGDSFNTAVDYIKPSEIDQVTKVVTSEGTIIRAPYKPHYRDRLILKHGLHSRVLFRKIITLFYSVLQYYFFVFDNKKGIFCAADDFIAVEKPDFIIATGEPFIMFRYASLLAKKHAIPWIADYRDYWSMDFNHFSFVMKIIYKYIFSSLEKRFVASARFITTVGPMNKALQQTLFPKKRVEIIMNGYFEEEYAGMQPTVESNEICTIAFGGTIYFFNPLELFIEGLTLFVKKHTNPKLRVVFYGSTFDAVQKERIVQCSKGIENYVDTTGRLGRAELFAHYNKATCLLLFNHQGMIPGKLFEYLPLKKPILLAGNDNGPIEHILNDTNTGIICNTAAQIADALATMYAEWEMTGTVRCESRNIEQYSRRFQTKQLANIIGE